MVLNPSPASPTAKAGVDRIPVSLLTGFLGAGKTTLLNHWIHQPGMAGVAVLVNEFGEVGIDHHLVDKLSDQMLLLDSGCLCCNVQGDLVAALKQLSDRSARGEIAPISRVVIETTGLADPVPVLGTLMEEPFVSARYVCDGVITAMAVTHGLAQLRDYAEATRQVVVADRLLLTKCDEASSAELAALSQALSQLNPHARQIQVRRGVADLDVLLAAGLYGRSASQPSLMEWLGTQALEEVSALAAPSLPRLLPDVTELTGSTADPVPDEGRHLSTRRRRRGAGDRHTPQVHSFVLTFDQEVPWFGFSVVMGQILRQYGSQLLRVKGLMRAPGDVRPLVVQCVQGMAYPPVRLAQWPREGPFVDGRGRLVFIARGLDEAAIASISRALQDLPNDRAALRASATDWTLPTRCWLSQRIPVVGAHAVHHEAWVVQPRHFAGLPGRS